MVITGNVHQNRRQKVFNKGLYTCDRKQLLNLSVSAFEALHIAENNDQWLLTVSERIIMIEDVKRAVHLHFCWQQNRRLKNVLSPRRNYTSNFG